MTPQPHFIRRVAAAVASMLAFGAGPALAAPDEIRVMTDDMTDVGEFGLELQAASVRARSGPTTGHLGQGLAASSYRPS